MSLERSVLRAGMTLTVRISLEPVNHIYFHFMEHNTKLFITGPQKMIISNSFHQQDWGLVVARNTDFSLTSICNRAQQISVVHLIMSVFQKMSSFK
jgi:hypothetical protein